MEYILWEHSWVEDRKGENRFASLSPKQPVKSTKKKIQAQQINMNLSNYSINIAKQYQNRNKFLSFSPVEKNSSKNIKTYIVEDASTYLLKMCSTVQTQKRYHMIFLLSD